MNRHVRRHSRVPMSEINVYPMVELMLVLLIILMVTAPLLTVRVEIGVDGALRGRALPKTEAGPMMPGQALVKYHYPVGWQDHAAGHLNCL